MRDINWLRQSNKLVIGKAFNATLYESFKPDMQSACKSKYAIMALWEYIKRWEVKTMCVMIVNQITW